MFVHLMVIVPVAVAVPALCFFFYRLGMVNTRAEIIRSFDEIISRIHQLSLSKNYDGLELMLNDLQRDSPPPELPQPRVVNGVKQPGSENRGRHE